MTPIWFKAAADWLRERERRLMPGMTGSTGDKKETQDDANKH